MDKNTFALTPPMGWNSYDYYNTSTDEKAMRENAEYIAKNLKEFGWEYVVVDIQWYSKHDRIKMEEYQYIPFEEVRMDEYSRLLPCLERFPSAEGDNGFKPLADYIHSLGLKFGIHIMRGIPRIAAHTHTAIKGTSVTADIIADPTSICFWNPDMYGVRPNKPESQLYYDSLMELYAAWGVDFIKCDDICRMDAPSAREEIRMLQEAIQKSGRPMVLSLSPGNAKIEQAWWYEKYSNMWRITDDFWDNWKSLYNMFERCEVWEKHVTAGNYPDCDMLPLGKLGGYHFGEFECRFNKEEQKTMMTLWSIFKSPMMIGAELTMMDDWTLSLLTNREILSMLKFTAQAKQLERTKKRAVWTNVSDDGVRYIALFNLSDEECDMEYSLDELSATYTKGMDLWSGEAVEVKNNTLVKKIPAHGVFAVKVC